MKVLILGATGFVGLPVAQAFVRAGHEVYGQTRSQDKAKLLASEEITPVVADPQNSQSWVEFAEKADVVINCIGGENIAPLAQKAMEVVVAAAKKARGGATPRLTYIYTSGGWVHGEDRVEIKSERSPIKTSAMIAGWRKAVEQDTVHDKDFDGIVIRPALLYGRSGSIMEMLFQQANHGKIEWGARKGGRWSLIHVDDLADLYVRVAEAAPICKNLIFDASNSQTELVEDILSKTAEVTGSTWSIREPAHPFEEAIATTGILRPSLARALVGWVPRKAGLVDGMRVYYAAWQATQQ